MDGRVDESVKRYCCVEDGYREGRKEGREEGKKGEGRERGREKRKAGHWGPGLTYPIPGIYIQYRHHKGSSLYQRSVPALPYFQSPGLDIHWGPCEPLPSTHPPTGLTGSLTVLQAVFHQVPIDATCPNPIWGPPLEGGGGICHILHCQVLGFTCGSFKDRERGEVGVNDGSRVSREGQGSEVELVVNGSTS